MSYVHYRSDEHFDTYEACKKDLLEYDNSRELAEIVSDDFDAGDFVDSFPYLSKDKVYDRAKELFDNAVKCFCEGGIFEEEDE